MKNNSRSSHIGNYICNMNGPIFSTEMWIVEEDEWRVLSFSFIILCDIVDLDYDLRQMGMRACSIVVFKVPLEGILVV